MDRRGLKLSKDETTACSASLQGAGYHERAARSFYEGMLGARQVWPTGPRATPRKLWFLVGTTLIPVSFGPAAGRLELTVDSPAAVAERCWDAGYAVRLCADASEDLVVIDPFGREIVLTSRRSVCSMGGAATG